MCLRLMQAWHAPHRIRRIRRDSARWWLAACLAMFLCHHGLVFSQQKELEALDALQTLSFKDNARALTELQSRAALFESSAFDEVKRVYLSTLIGAEFDAGRPDRAQAAIDRLLALSQATKDDIGIVLANTAAAHRQASSGQVREAIVRLNSVEAAALRSADPEALWIFHLVMGSLQNTTGMFEPALAHILKSMDFARARPRQSQASLLRSQVQLGLVYMSMKNGEKALKTISDAMLIARSLEAVSIMGALSLNRGNIASSMGRHDTAIEAYQAALDIGQRSGQTGLQAAALNNIGDIHLIRREYAKAEPIERRAIAKYLEAGDAAGAALSRANVGFALMGQGRIDEGTTEVKAALEFLRSAGARTTQEIILEELSRMYEQAGRFREAVETVREQQILSKELFRSDREQAVARLQEQFNSVQRERQIEALASANKLKDAEIHNRRLMQTATAIGMAVVVVVGGVIALLYRRTRRANHALQEAKLEADKALSDKSIFLATASHDLRQPIHAMSMMVEAIGLRNKSPAIAPLLVDLKSSMNAMRQLFNALLDLSKLETGMTAVRAVPVSLPSMLGEVAKMFREQAVLGGLDLRLHLPRRNAVVLADPILLRQALANLTHNALRYTRKGGILLAVRRRGDDWLIEVWDTGMGIATGDDHQVFSPYYRSPDASQVDSAGYGLGLAVVARCAKLMNATCGLQSRLGKGSRFWLRLCAVDTPWGAAAPGLDGPSGAEATAWKPLSGRCLVLDDDLQVIAAWKAMLEGWGMQARFATTAAEAFAHLEQGFLPDAIFCDQRLRSGESGFDVLRQLLACCPGASGAMVSGELNSDELTKAEDDGYLVFRKPLDLAALHAVLESWLRRRESDLVATDSVES